MNFKIVSFVLALSVSSGCLGMSILPASAQSTSSTPIQSDSVNHRNLMSSTIKKYLLNRYTRRRLERYCRSDTRCIQISQSPKLSCTMSGILYDELEKGVGLVSWNALIKRGKPFSFELTVDKGRPYLWVLHGKIDRDRAYTDDDFERELLLKVLSNSLYSYQKIRWNDKFLRDEIEKRLIQKIDHLDWSYDHRLTGLQAKQSNGKTMTARISPDFALSSISVDGQLDTVWANAYAEREKNIKSIVEMDSSIYRTMKK